MRRPLPVVAALLLALLPGPALLAQASGPLPTLKSGSLLRVEQRDGDRVQGMLVSQDRQVLILRQDHSPRQVALSDLRRVWVRRRSTGTGAIIGALAGGVGGGVLYNFFARVGCESSHCHITEATLAGSAIGAAGGALAGAIIGAAIPRWRLRFP